MSVCLFRLQLLNPSHRNFILVCRYIFTISRSSLSIRVFRLRSNELCDNFTYFNMLILCMWLQVINKVKVTQYHIKVKVKISTSLQRRGNKSFQSKIFKGINLQGIPNSLGAPTYDLAKVSKELREIEKFLGLRRGTPSQIAKVLLFIF